MVKKTVTALMKELNGRVERMVAAAPDNTIFILVTAQGNYHDLRTYGHLEREDRDKFRDMVHDRRRALTFVGVKNE